MILAQIEQYWTGRAEGYSQVNQHELATGQDRVWLDEIRRHLPEGALKILMLELVLDFLPFCSPKQDMM